MHRGGTRRAAPACDTGSVAKFPLPLGFRGFVSRGFFSAARLIFLTVLRAVSTAFAGARFQRPDLNASPSRKASPKTELRVLPISSAACEAESPAVIYP